MHNSSVAPGIGLLSAAAGMLKLRHCDRQTWHLGRKVVYAPRFDAPSFPTAKLGQ